jgi:L-ribulose-5-phosphate 3-epimerase
MNRRDWLLSTFGTFALARRALATPPAAHSFALRPSPMAIGACDWSIGPAASLDCFDVAKQIGLDGVQLSFNTAKMPLHLQQKSVQEAVLAAAERTGVRVGGLGIGSLNDVPYKSEARTQEWVHDSIGAARAIGAKNVLLAFFAKNDLRKDDVGKAEVVRKLKEVAPVAEKAGVSLAIESYLTAEEHLDIIQRVGSQAIKVYYDPRNATDAGNDIFREMPMLRDHICELHIKENGVRLGKGTIDWPRVHKTLTDMGYVGDGWMQIEWAMSKGEPVVDAYRANLDYVKKTLI